MAGGVRGKYYKAYRAGHTAKIHKSDGTTTVQYFTLEEGAVMLEPDVQDYFSRFGICERDSTFLDNAYTPKTRGGCRGKVRFEGTCAGMCAGAVG